MTELDMYYTEELQKIEKMVAPIRKKYVHTNQFSGV